MPSRNQGSALIVILSIAFGILIIMAIAAWLYFQSSSSVVLPGGPQPSLPPRDTGSTLTAVLSPSASPLINQATKNNTCSSGITKAADRLIENGELSTTSVEQALKDSGAQCKDSALYTAKNEKILFYRLGGCYGKSADEIKKQIDDQAGTVTRLKQNYWVLEVACNPHVLP